MSSHIPANGLNFRQAARSDAICHMIASGVRPIDIIAMGIPPGSVTRALRTRDRLRLAAKAVRS